MEQEQVLECDLLIHGAMLYDGSGQPARTADVAVTGDRVVAVGDLRGTLNPAETVDANGLALAPGFIDAHTHDDRAVLSSPDMSMKLSQGVTSVIGGNCGISLAPLSGIEPPPPPGGCQPLLCEFWISVQLMSVLVPKSPLSSARSKMRA